MFSTFGELFLILLVIVSSDNLYVMFSLIYYLYMQYFIILIYVKVCCDLESFCFFFFVFICFLFLLSINDVY